MGYKPEPLLLETQDPAVQELGRYLSNELQRLAGELENGVDAVFLPELNVEPGKPRNGQITFADGTNFAPGRGQGFYGRFGDIWFPLGSALVFNVKHFGAKGDSVTDDTSAFEAARAAVLVAGGEIYIPAGTYKLSAEWLFITSGTKFIRIRGEQQSATILDFATAPAGSDGIQFDGTGFFFSVEDLQVRNAPASGIHIAGVSPNNVAYFTLKRVVSRANGESGFKFADCWMGGTIERCLGSFNTEHGFELIGFHTSMTFINCHSQSNTSDGWSIDDINYSNWISCAADNDGGHGYRIKNIQSSTFVSCGAESSVKTAFLVEGGSGLIAGRTLQVTKGLSFIGCYANDCDTGATGANFMELNASNDSTLWISATAMNCTDRINTSTTPLSLKATNGNVRLREVENVFASGVSFLGFTRRVRPVEYDNDPFGIAVTSANTVIATLTDGHDRTDQYGGTITVAVRSQKWGNQAASNSAYYLLHVAKWPTNQGAVTVINSEGLTAGSGATHPSFTWSIDAANNQLRASPVGSTSATFYFDIYVQGDLRATIA